MQYSKILIALAGLGLCASAWADMSDIQNANNQASIQYLMGKQIDSYSPQNTYFNNVGSSAIGTQGGLINISKLIGGRLYTDLQMSFMRSGLAYTPALSYGNATSNTINVQGKLGWSFYPTDTTALTPYATLGFLYNQIDTGGALDPVSGYSLAGSTQLTQFGYSGLGLLSQWSPIDQLVLSLDLSAGETFAPFEHANLPIPVVGGASAVIYQSAVPTVRPWGMAAFNMDYRVSQDLHTMLGVQYIRWSLRGAEGQPDVGVAFPSWHQTDLIYSFGLGYQFGDSTYGYFILPPNQEETLHAANNQASISLGGVNQNYGEYSPGTSSYLDRQQGAMPIGQLTVTKTFGPVYTQIQSSEAVGTTNYIGSLMDGTPFDTTTRNTVTNLSARLGYQFLLTQNNSLALTPYVGVGYRRWLRDTAGVPYAGYLLNGYPETYVSHYYAVGLLTQYAVFSNWVLSAYGEYGRTFSNSLTTWAPVSGTTAQSEFGLYNRNYWGWGVGSDYCFFDHWHLLANVGYQYFGFGQSNANSLGYLEPSSRTFELTMTGGIGYSF